MKIETEEATYIKDHYGLCEADKCFCMKTDWVGRKCPYWQSCNCNTYEELGTWQRNLKNANFGSL